MGKLSFLAKCICSFLILVFFFCYVILVKLKSSVTIFQYDCSNNKENNVLMSHSLEFREGRSRVRNINKKQDSMNGQSPTLKEEKK